MAPGYNKTRCGPPVPYCEKNESCLARLSKASFLPGLKVKSWVAIPKVLHKRLSVNVDKEFVKTDRFFFVHFGLCCIVSKYWRGAV